MSEDQNVASKAETDEPKRYRFGLRTLLLSVLTFCVVPGIVWNWIILPRREAARIRSCGYQLKQIGIAICNYEDNRRSLPYAVTFDEHGKPIHSWRMRIMPYVESSNFYVRYQYDEPWDGPNNSKFAAPCPRFLRCRASGASASDLTTNYVAITGPGTAFPEDRTVLFGEMTDGLSATIFISEIARSDIHWMEPRDLHIDRMSFQINDKTKPSISSHHRGGAHVLFADGSVRFLRDSTPPEIVRALLTIDGGEEIDWDQVE